MLQTICSQKMLGRNFVSVILTVPKVGHMSYTRLSPHRLANTRSVIVL